MSLFYDLIESPAYQQLNCALIYFQIIVTASASIKLLLEFLVPSYSQYLLPSLEEYQLTFTSVKVQLAAAKTTCKLVYVVQ
jgi:hypothetical protein